MNKGWLIVYRIVGILISFYAYMFLFSCLGALFSGAQVPYLLILVFIAACLVIYSVLSNMFGRLVLAMKQPIRASLKDWIKINAMVSVVVYGLLLFCMLMLVTASGLVEQSLRQHPEMLQIAPTVTLTTTQFWAFIKGFLILCLLISGHCIWTLVLVRRFREYFK